MPGTPLITFSNGVATVLEPTSALAPRYLARTFIEGGAISGKSSIGRVKKERAPNRVMNREMTSERIGRRMKISNIYAYFLTLLIVVKT